VPAPVRTRTRRALPKKRPHRAAAPPRVPGTRSDPPDAPRPLLAERPHAHIVCRGCGRIAPLNLDLDEELRLEAIARASPDGWSVDLVAFSLTGTCPRCRQGPVAPE
jgi:hypothetical protein